MNGREAEMGKRSDYERVDRDRYMTPLDPVLRLIPHLHRGGVETFADLCDGGGGIGLVQHLERAGFRCVHRSDIVNGQDALQVERYIGNPDAGITNPPFRHPEDPKHSTRLLRELIQHFLDLGIPFWLLLPHDWSTNKNAAPFLKRCTDIVAVGRVKWIPDSEFTGKDNSCWYRFDVHHRGNVAFRNDRDKPVSIKQAPPTAEAAE
jgi:hypothetical protein